MRLEQAELAAIYWRLWPDAAAGSGERPEKWSRRKLINRIRAALLAETLLALRSRLEGGPDGV